VFSKQDVKNGKSCTPHTGIALFVTPISREKIGWFPILKLRTHFAIDSQRDLKAQAPDLLIIIDALFKELMQFPRDAKHLVNFVKVLLLETNHFPGVFLKKN
jgi:hypothetical protein